MVKNDDKTIVKYDDKYWVLEGVSDSNNMATIWRNGQPALIPVGLLEKVEEKNKG
ncbi:hypothetical protein AB3N02_22055 [Priestia aryabhattai]|uniref:hypothetical protein n=1 Tax=Priestia aryabhattai TaxID=412384 RepID=UPI00399F107E